MSPGVSQLEKIKELSKLTGISEEELMEIMGFGVDDKLPKDKSKYDIISALIYATAMKLNTTPRYIESIKSRDDIISEILDKLIDRFSDIVAESILSEITVHKHEAYDSDGYELDGV